MARLWWLWFSSGLALASAGAADPVVSRPGPTEVVGHVDVAADPAAVFALVAVPEAVAAVAGPNTTASSVADGDCLLVTTRTTHALGAATYRSRSCPDGRWSVRQELVDGDLKEFSSRWWVELLPGGGARLHYRIQTVSTLPLPQFVVDRSAARSVKDLLARLRDHLES